MQQKICSILTEILCSNNFLRDSIVLQNVIVLFVYNISITIEIIRILWQNCYNSHLQSCYSVFLHFKMAGVKNCIIFRIVSSNYFILTIAIFNIKVIAIKRDLYHMLFKNIVYNENAK